MAAATRHFRALKLILKTTIRQIFMHTEIKLIFLGYFKMKNESNRLAVYIILKPKYA